MIDFSLAVLADQAIVARDGKVSLIGMFRNVVLQKVPQVYPKFTVAAVISQVDKPLKVAVELVDLKENQTLVKLQEAKFVPPRVGDNIQIIVDLVALPFKSFGKHEVRILIDGKIQRFIPFNVIKASLPALKK